MDTVYAVYGIRVCESPDYSVDFYREVWVTTIPHTFNSVFLLTFLHWNNFVLLNIL